MPRYYPASSQSVHADWARVVGACVAAVSAGLTVAATSKYGVGATADTATYISAAEAWLAGHGLATYASRPMVEFPPLYPLILAGSAQVLPFDTPTVARWLNVLLTGMTVALGFRLARRCIRRTWLMIFAGASVAASPVVLHVSSYGWSELLLIVLVLASVELLCRAEERPDRWAPLVLSGLVAAAAVLTRYLGVTYVLAGAGTLLFITRDFRVSGSSWKRQVLRTIIWSAPAVIGLAAWFARNLVVADSLSGHRPPSTVGLLANARLAVSVVSTWLAPAWTPALLRGLLVAVSVGVAAAGVARALRDRKAQALSASTAPLLLAAYGVVYGLAIVVMRSTVEFDPLDHRLLAPLYVPAALVLASGIDRMLDLRKERSPRIELAAALIIVAWFVYPVVSAASWLSGSLRSGAGGYATAEWQKSELIEHLRRHRYEQPITSNDGAALYLLARLPSSPAPGPPGHWRPTLDEFAAHVALAGSVTLVWFEHRGAAGALEPSVLADVLTVNALITTEDGAVYVISARDRAVPR
jgi:4-amino-4-deoxy-L-arabinose transferase-like glycosyltransferase